MYRMVIDTLNEYQPIWEGTPKFVELHGEISGIFEQLQVHAEKQRAYTLGVKASRDALRGEVALLATRISSALTALGAEQNDLELIAQMHITESQLKRFSHSDVIILLDRIRIHATQHAEALVEFGITEDEMETFIQKRDELMATIMAPRKAILKRKDSTAKILSLCEQMDQLFKHKLDKLVNVLRPSSESLYIEYTAARMILDYGHSTPHGDGDPTGEI